MRVLWFSNIAIPKIAQKIGMDTVHVGGWMVKLADELAATEETALGIAFPYKENLEGKTEKIDFFSFASDSSKICSDSWKKQDKRIREIIEKFSPDIIHIFGTEYPHSYTVTKICKELEMSSKIVISIQGLTSVYSRHYYAYLENRQIYGSTFRDLYKGNVHKGRKNFEQSGKFEVRAIKNVEHIIGRTDWDEACTSIINPDAKYHFNNEMLRDSFYRAESWEFEKCQKYSIFLSQATMPLKGLHLALEAAVILKQEYPELQINIAGKSYYQKKKWKLSFYEKSILQYIDQHDLKENVRFLGFLDEEQMCRQYLKSHVFVSASSIENSPNSVCEAMLLGVPVVSSMVGGVANLIEHGKDGYYYQADAPYMLAYYVKRIFENRELAERISICARSAAKERHSVEKIVIDLKKIYQEIITKR